MNRRILNLIRFDYALPARTFEARGWTVEEGRRVMREWFGLA